MLKWIVYPNVAKDSDDLDTQMIALRHWLRSEHGRDLTSNGLVKGSVAIDDIDSADVARAIEHIHRVFKGTAGTTENTRTNSYGGKHTLEKWRRNVLYAHDRSKNPYISNGTFIAACFLLGFSAHFEDDVRSPNCKWAMRALKDVRHELAQHNIFV